MQKIFFPIAALTALVFFTHCKNEKTTTTNTSITESPSSKGFYKHLKGSIGNFPVTMDIVQMQHNAHDDMEAFVDYSGYYYYDKYQKPIVVNGLIDSTGNLMLEEWSNEGSSARFLGKMNADGTYIGIWQDASGKKPLAFNLKENYSDGAIAFDFYAFEDSLKLWKDQPNSPLAEFDMRFLLPNKNTEGGVFSFLKDKIFTNLKGDSIEKSYATLSPDALHSAQRDTFFKNYLDMFKDEKPQKTEMPAMSMNATESSNMSILFNESGLLSIGYGIYEYSGGAHGNHATILKTHNLVDKKTMTLTDVFKPGYEKIVDAALGRAVREKFNLKITEPLSSALFEDKIEHNDNFSLTKKGITFLYNPYEIASYAQGEIELFIPFDLLKSVLK